MSDQPDARAPQTNSHLAAGSKHPLKLQWNEHDLAPCRNLGTLALRSAGSRRTVPRCLMGDRRWRTPRVVRPQSMGEMAASRCAALDITHDRRAASIRSSPALVACARRSHQVRICNGHCERQRAKHAAWQWRPIPGSNKHNRHVHLGEGVDRRFRTRDSTAGVAEVSPTTAFSQGSEGPFVVELQRNLVALGFGPLMADGEFGDRTEAAVKRFQRSAGLKDDGWAGPRTLEAIGKALGERAAQPKIELAKMEGQADAREAAKEEVEKKTGFWQKLTGALGFGGTAGGFLWAWSGRRSPFRRATILICC